VAAPPPRTNSYLIHTWIKLNNALKTWDRNCLTSCYTIALRFLTNGIVRSQFKENTMAASLSAVLEPLAAWFRSLGIPEPITHWGHPAMMAIVAIFMGGFAAYSGWQSRVTTDEAVKAKMKADHRKVAPLMALFLGMGYTGGVLSLVMQQKPILESPHFWTGTLVLGLLATQALVSLGFGNDKGTLRSLHAYVGSALIGILVIHGILGLNLGLSI
jgi:hypothetical protein